MTEAEKHIEVLSTLIANGFFALVDDGETRALAAIEWLMAETERLTTKDRRLRDEITLLSGILRDLENCDDDEFVGFEDHEKTVSEIQDETDKLKTELSIANSKTTKLEGDLYTCQESLSYVQWSHPDASSESLFSGVSRWLSELTGWSPRRR
jgi:chromosome segregation ATPase